MGLGSKSSASFCQHLWLLRVMVGDDERVHSAETSSTSSSHENPRAVPGLPLQHQLKLPEFEWYLGPMYQRYEEILAERSRKKPTKHRSVSRSERHRQADIKS